MKSAFSRIISRILILSMLALPFQAAQAGMIGTDQVVLSTAAMDRDAVIQTLDRPEVARQLQAMGLDAGAAKDRVAAMTDEEVRTLAGQINSAPAGARVTGWGWAVIIALGIWAWYAWGR